MSIVITVKTDNFDKAALFNHIWPLARDEIDKKSKDSKILGKVSFPEQAKYIKNIILHNISRSQTHTGWMWKIY